MLIGLVLILLAGGGLVVIAVLLLTAQNVDPLASRVQGIRNERAGAASTRYTPGGVVVIPSTLNEAQVEAARRARSDQGKVTMHDRLVQAGLYKAYSPTFFAMVRIFLALVPLGIALFVGLSGQVSLLLCMAVGLFVAGVGTLAPSLWLDHLKAVRQKRLRRSLPDALDVIVICLEGGLSLTGAITRVANELTSAHPLLAMELRIVLRGVQMGRPMGETLREMARRFDLEELRSLAGVISQAEKFGTSVVRALTVYAETMRSNRSQRAEELAHQASIKMIFPTLFCIFPAIFVVILGPAAIRIYEQFIVKTVGGL